VFDDLTPTPSTFDILRARRARASRAPHGDGARVALAIEGGAMRGVISAGMVSALEELGFTEAFDEVYGSSAGAINGAYFLAGQARLGTTVYYEDINSRSFIDMRRAVLGRPIVDLGFLLDDVAVSRKVLDVERVLRATSPLAVLATAVDTGTAETLRAFRSGADLMQALRASATMPIVAGLPRELGGRRYLDASLTQPIPVPAAEADGHTHILVLLTRSGHMRARPSAFDRFYVAPRLRRVSPTLASRYLTRAGPYSALLRQIDAGRGPLGRAVVTAVRVEALTISKLERRRAVLEAGARLGRDAVLRALDTRS
jgi:predicted patatin/cPLA2 family phospholipase